MKLGLLLVSLAVLAGCPTPTPVTPPPDADAASSPPPPPSSATVVPPVFVPLPDAAVSGDAGGSLAAAACARLTRLGCAEGCDGGRCFQDQGASCVEVLEKIEAARLTALNLPCVADAGSPAIIRGCAPAWRDACGKDGGR